jgi:hypothetical protein
MTTDIAAGPLVTDGEIRAWARATNRTVTERGQVPAILRAEYEQYVADSQATDPDGAAPDSGGPARKEAVPRKVRPAGRAQARVRGWLGSTRTASTGKPKGKKVTHPRVPVTGLIERGWERLASVAARLNAPTGRCMEWQAPYAGIVLEDAVRGTIVDKVLQPVARAEAKLSAVGSLVAMPLIVYALQLPANQPDTVPGAVRHQMLMLAAEECIEAQLESMGGEGVAERVRAAQEARAARKAEAAEIIAMIFAPLADEQEQAPQQAEQEAMHRAAVQVAGMAPVPDGQPVRTTRPDNRGTGQPASPTGARKPRMTVTDQGKVVPE